MALPPLGSEQKSTSTVMKDMEVMRRVERWRRAFSLFATFICATLAPLTTLAPLEGDFFFRIENTFRVLCDESVASWPPPTGDHEPEKEILLEPQVPTVS